MHICICKCICKYIFIRKIIFQTPFVSFHDTTQVFRDVTFVFGQSQETWESELEGLCLNH